jgi:hypothetical protein
VKVIRVHKAPLLIVAGLVLLGSGMSVAQASKPAPDHKVTLCHRTGSVDGGNQHNGYSVITVDIASVANAKDARGHDDHNQIGNGPGGDIIPVYTYGDFTYSGKNLGGGGQAFLDHGCNATPPTTTTTTTTTPVTTTTTTPVTTTTTTPVTTTTTTEALVTPTSAVTTPPGEVKGVVKNAPAVKGVVKNAPAVKTLAFTGAETVPLGLYGLFTLVLGAVLTVASRRQRPKQVRE